MKSCLLKALHGAQSYIYLKGRSTYYFHLGREVLKNDGGKMGQHWELKLALLVPGEHILIFYVCCFSFCIIEEIELLINNVSKNVNPTP